jgi:uncharacterized protein with PQ loop repeat
VRETLANLAVIGATAMTVAFLIPQIAKLIRSRDSAGVSTTWPALGLVTNLGWFSYMVSQGLWVSIGAPTLTVIGYATMLWALSRAGRDLRRSAVLAGLWMLGLATTVGVAGWVTLGVILGLSTAVQLTPSVLTAYRTPDPSGISPATWWIGLTEGALWGSFGLFHSDAGILTFAVVNTIGSVSILVRYHRTRSTAADDLIRRRLQPGTLSSGEETGGKPHRAGAMAVAPHHRVGIDGEWDLGIELGYEVGELTQRHHPGERVA